MKKETNLPVAIIGAGPVGLAAAAHLHQRNRTFVVLESGPAVGASVRKWAHVRVFSPWRYMIDESARALLSDGAWIAPDPEGYPTGGELVRQYLEPLANSTAIRESLRLGARVTSVTRHGYDKLKSGGREQAPFMVTYESAGAEHQMLASAVIDASGTYEQPKPLGASGIAAVGERQAHDRIFYGIPDLLHADRARYANKHVIVVGSGHSAFNALLELSALVASAPDTRTTWLIRRAEYGLMFGGQSADGLSARGELGATVMRLLDNGVVQVHTDVRIASVARTDAGVAVVADDDRRFEAEEIIACTGFRPDLDMLRELRLALDDRTEAPIALAPMIDPNVHSCGSVPPHGWAELKHPAEPGFYIVGMKSYGRAPTFLMLTGYEQVRSITAAIAGDMEAALDVRLVLPQTGVCSGPVGACCDVDPALGALADQTGDCGCNTGCCAAPTSRTGSLISIDSIFANAG